MSIVAYAILLWLTYCEYKVKYKDAKKSKKVLYICAASFLGIVAGTFVSILGYLILTM
jgi:hypothetical protein